MIRRLLPGSLRAQLALAIALVTAFAVGLSFVALYSDTASRLRGQIDAQLRTQRAEWNQFAAGAGISTPAALRRAGAGFIAAQRYHAEALIITIQPAAGRIVTNDPEVVAREQALRTGAPETPELLNAKPGVSTVSVAEAGNMRVLTQPIVSGGRHVGTLRVASPLRPVEQAQASLRRSFLVVGIVALALAVAVGIGLATLIAAPLRRVSRVAEAATAGDLSMRAGPTNARGELRVLSSAFDHMLERLERAFKRQRDFVSDASHELRTPLAVMRAQVELLDTERDEARRHEGTATLLRRLDELDRLVGDMLTLAGAEAGELVEPRPLDLRGFFDDLRRDLPLFGDREFTLEAVDGALEADPDRLTQVLRNLIRNAVAHTHPGQPVSITSDAHDGRLEITVADAGPGIPADQLDQIFERFRRLDGSRSRMSGGAGLGLAIARAITEAHGGRITVESRVGMGSAFHVELPGYRAA